MGQQVGRVDSIHSQPREWHMLPIRTMLGNLCVVGVNDHVSMVRGTRCSLAPNSQFSQIGLCEAAQFLQGIVFRHGEAANVGSQQAQRNSLRVWR